MDAFVWDACYQTDIADIDDQHRQLVALANHLGDLVAGEVRSEPAEIRRALVALMDYAHVHFAMENSLMGLSEVDPRHVSRHRSEHGEFFRVVNQLQAVPVDELPDRAADILNYVCGWLGAHILGTDQALARQIRLIRAGASPAAAYAQGEAGSDPAVQLLTQAVSRLYSVVRQRNEALNRYAEDLEETVARRTAQLEAALAQLAMQQQVLVQAEKLSAIGQLAAGVAHEINNPVGFVGSNLNTLENYVHQLLSILQQYETMASQCPGCSPALALVQKTYNSSDMVYLREDILALIGESQEGLARVRQIVIDLRDFSRHSGEQFVPADLNAGVQKTLNVAHNEVKYKAEVITRLGELPMVCCNIGQISQVVLNLVVNAAQAIEKNGTISISTEVQPAADGRPGVRLSVRDTGKGMPPEIIARIFDPFFTTKPSGVGTGLGLALANGIVDRHGGYFTVESQPGQGSTFSFWLPIDGPAAPASPEKPNADRAENSIDAVG